MLDDLNIQTNALMDRENYLHQIQALRQQHKRVVTEYNDFINWCKVVQLSVGGDEDVTYERQRDALRFLKVKTLVYHTGADVDHLGKNSWVARDIRLHWLLPS